MLVDVIFEQLILLSMRLLILLCLLLATLPVQAQQTVTELSFEAEEFAYSVANDRIYALARGDLSGALLELNAQTGQSLDTTFVGQLPLLLHASLDGSRIYTVTRGDEQALVEVDATSLDVTRRTPLELGGSPLTIYGLSASRVDGAVSALSYGRETDAGSEYGIVIALNGTLLPERIVTPEPVSVTFGEGDRLYAYKGSFRTPPLFYRLSVGSQGATLITIDGETTLSPLTTENSDPLLFADGLLFANQGQVADGEARARVASVRVDPEGWDDFLVPLVSPEGGTVLYLVPHQYIGEAPSLYRFDQEALELTAREAVPFALDDSPYSVPLAFTPTGLLMGSSFGPSVLTTQALTQDRTPVFSPSDIILGSDEALTGALDYALELPNTGADTLRFTRIYAMDERITVEPSSADVPPGDTAIVRLSLEPTRADRGTLRTGIVLETETVVGGGFYLTEGFVPFQVQRPTDPVRGFVLELYASMQQAFVTFDADTLDLGTAELGTERIVTSTVSTLRTPDDVVVDSVRLTNDAFRIEQFPPTLSASGSSETYRLGFDATEIGRHDGQLVVYSSAYSSPDTLNLTAEASGIARAQIAPDLLAIGMVLFASSVDTAIVVRSVGSDTLRVDRIEASSGFSLSPSSFSVAPGDSLTVTLTFRAMTMGSISGMVRLIGNTASPLLLQAAALVVTALPDEDASKLIDALGSPQPQPARASTTIGFSLASPGPCRITLYDVRGQEVRALMDEVCPAGPGSVRVDGRALSSGAYFIRLESASFKAVRPLMIVD